MISLSRQLKDKVRNISYGNSSKATTLIRNFMMERFLERVSISPYRDNFILKGEMIMAYQLYVPLTTKRHYTTI